MVKSSDATTVREVKKIQQVPVWYSIVLPQNSTVPPANSTVKRKKSTLPPVNSTVGPRNSTVVTLEFNNTTS